MILDRYINAAVQAALGNGVRIDVKTQTEEEKAQPQFTPNPTGAEDHQYYRDFSPVVDLQPDFAFDKYKAPFFFVTGVLIGVAFGLRHGKVVVLR